MLWGSPRAARSSGWLIAKRMPASVRASGGVVIRTVGLGVAVGLAVAVAVGVDTLAIVGEALGEAGFLHLVDVLAAFAFAVEEED